MLSWSSAKSSVTGNLNHLGWRRKNHFGGAGKGGLKSLRDVDALPVTALDAFANLRGGFAFVRLFVGVKKGPHGTLCKLPRRLPRVCPHNNQAGCHGPGCGRSGNSMAPDREFS